MSAANLPGVPPDGSSRAKAASPVPPVFEVFFAFLKQGLTAFGGPVAHLGFFHREFVERRGWVDEQAYADLVALCQFLPGPASSQVGMALGLTRAGLPGMLAAWLGFTLPSAILMIGLAYGIAALGQVGETGWVRGLKLAAVAVVAQAVWDMAVKLCPDRPRATLALAAAIGVLWWPASAGQALVIALGAAVGWMLFRRTAAEGEGESSRGVVDRLEGAPARRRVLSPAWGAAALGLFVILLLGLPMLAAGSPASSALGVFNGFYWTSSLVFGGGHLVLPLLQTVTVDKGLVSADRFLAGYGAAQTLPGPLFTFAGYLGASLHPPAPSGWVGGLLCLFAIFLPSALLVCGILPFWERLRRLPAAQAALRGTNAAVVGVLLAALYHPVWTSAVHGPREFALVLAVFGSLALWRLPPWLAVIMAAVAGELLLR